ncbi:hypothetical protein ACROYT_G015118 [Oculina patagonica]
MAKVKDLRSLCSRLNLATTGGHAALIKCIKEARKNTGNLPGTQPPVQHGNEHVENQNDQSNSSLGNDALQISLPGRSASPVNHSAKDTAMDSVHELPVKLVKEILSDGTLPPASTPISHNTRPHPSLSVQALAKEAESYLRMSFAQSTKKTYGSDLAPFQITKRTKICSWHFKPNDFQTDLAGCRVLKHHAVPSIFQWFAPSPKRKSPHKRSQPPSSSAEMPSFSGVSEADSDTSTADKINNLRAHIAKLEQQVNSLELENKQLLKNVNKLL